MILTFILHVSNVPFYAEEIVDQENIAEPQKTYVKFLYMTNDEHFECFKKKGLHFLHLNARSLLPKISELKLITARSKAAVISITESWLDSSVTNTEIDIEGYNVIRKDRNRNGGGVCVYIRDDLAFSARSDLQTEDETLWFELLLPKTMPIIKGTCYRPPKQEDFLDNFENILSKLRSDCETIILGDFNICFLKQVGCLQKKYLNILRMFNLRSLFQSPLELHIQADRF